MAAMITSANQRIPVGSTGTATRAASTSVHHAPVVSRRNHPTEMQRRQFEKLIMPHESSLYAPAMALTHSASDAEDLVQETLVRAYDRFDTFRADGSPRAWLHTIMRNLFFNAYRKRSREPKQVSLEFFDPATSDLSGSGVGIASRVAPNQPTSDSPERQVISEMEGSAVLEAVRNLPAEYRQVVAMADIQGMPYQDIADQLNIPIGTVRSRLSRGRERVRRAVFSWRPTVEAEGFNTNALVPA